MDPLFALFPGHGVPPPTQNYPPPIVGGPGGGGQVPEISMDGAGMALTLLIGFTLILFDRTHKVREA